MQQSKVELMQQFVMDWLKMTDEHPECVLGDWMHTFSIMTGISLQLAGITEDSVDDAIDRMAIMIRSSYENSKTGFQPSSLQ